MFDEDDTKTGEVAMEHFSVYFVRNPYYIIKLCDISMAKEVSYV